MYLQLINKYQYSWSSVYVRQLFLLFPLRMTINHTLVMTCSVVKANVYVMFSLINNRDEENYD